MPRGHHKKLKTKSAIKIAKELNYGEDVIKKIKACKSDSEIDRVMYDARNR